jgi:chromosome segregation ATPase
MDAITSTVATTQPQQRTTKDYKSPPHALIGFFRKSRDNWKRKYQVIQRQLKKFKNTVSDLTKSREQWKLKAEQAIDQLTVLKAECDRLRAQVATLTEKKTTRTSTG